MGRPGACRDCSRRGRLRTLVQACKSKAIGTPRRIRPLCPGRSGPRPPATGRGDESCRAPLSARAVTVSRASASIGRRAARDGRAVRCSGAVLRRDLCGKRLASKESLLEGQTMKAFACAFGVILAATTWSAPAAALQITFDDLASVGNPLVTTVETHGYRLTGPVLPTNDTPGTPFVGNGPAGLLLPQGGRPRSGRTPARRQPRALRA